MASVDEVYAQEHLVTIDPFQFNALILALARHKLPNFIMTKDWIEYDKPFLGLEWNGKMLLIQPCFPDRRFYAPKVDYDLWVEFETIDPEGAEPKVRPN